MTERDPDRAWLEALAGRGGTGDEGAEREEARRLRERILAREVAEAPAVAAFDPRREEQLIARARREGLLPQGRSTRWRSWHGVAALAAAASIFVVVGFLSRLNPPPAPETVRSAPGGITRIEARGAHELQHLIADELMAAGVPATLYDRLGSYGLDADLPSPLPENVADVLRRHRIPAPHDGVLKVEIAEPPRP